MVGGGAAEINTSWASMKQLKSRASLRYHNQPLRHFLWCVRQQKAEETNLSRLVAQRVARVMVLIHHSVQVGTPDTSEDTRPHFEHQGVSKTCGVGMPTSGSYTASSSLFPPP